MNITSNSCTKESVSGLVERVTFFNEETGFAVLRVKAKGHRDLVTVIGSLASVNPGEWLTAEGAWVRDREHGLQFKADLLKAAPPTTREGIEKYLGSGMVKGIGPIYAKKLVSKFGEKIFEIIDQFSVRLEEVEGVGPARRRRIKEAWAEQQFVRGIMVFLHSHGVSTSRAVRIYKAYGETAIDKVRADPYTLARDIHGIGFTTADQIAQRVGIPRDSILRASAGLAHALQEAVDDGHCALPRGNLISHAIHLLEVEERIVAEALAGLLNKRELIQEQMGEETLIFLPRLRQAEQTIANKLLQLAKLPANYPAIDIAKATAWCEKQTGRQLAPSQREALATALTRQVLIITGGPGVGKTTLMNSILMILNAKRVKCILCAPTGRAAKRLSETTGLDAQTIHRLLEFQPGAAGFTRNDSRPLDGGLIVVDESSMVDVPLMSQLLRAHPSNASLILVGDVDQLPSVGPGAVLNDIIRSDRIPVVRLTEIFRQAAGSRIVTNAHRVNQGELPDSGEKDSASDFYFVERNEPDRILSTLLDMVQNRIPQRLGCDPIRDIQVLCPMNRGSLGVRELNLRLQSCLNPERPDEPIAAKFGWQFRLRDKVIQTENNYDKEVFNGDIGQISRIDPIEHELVIRFDQRDVTYDFNELDEVSLAFCITIHKAQGSEFPAVVIPLAMQQYILLQRNLLYTGITRGKNLVVLVGQKKALQAAVKNNRTRHRYSGLFSRLIVTDQVGDN